MTGFGAEDAPELVVAGRRRHVVGVGMAGENQGVHAHPLVYPARPEVACGGTATVASGGDGSGSDGRAVPAVSGSDEGRRS